MDADRLILRDGGLQLFFSGVDQGGAFKIDGFAKQTQQGNYVASNVKLIYHRYNSNDCASIRIDVIRPSEKQLRCYIEGSWLQDGGSSLFSGNLRKFTP